MFITSLKVSPYNERQWELLDSLVFKHNNTTYIVPRGFITDFATIPRIFWSILPKTGEYTQASVLHDYLLTCMPRDEADKLFYIAMKESGVSWWKRSIIYLAVRLYSKCVKYL